MTDFDTRIMTSRPRPTEAGQSVLAFLSGRFRYHTEPEWQERLDRGEVSVDGVTASGGEIVSPACAIEWRPGNLPEPPVDRNYQVLYEDAAVVAVDKPGNLPTHPAGPFFRHTLWHLLKERYTDIFPVNRLDRETSGVVLLARNSPACARLSRQLGGMEKSYLVWVEGHFAAPLHAAGTLVPDTTGPVRKKQRFVPGGETGLSAVTDLLPLEYREDMTLVEARPVTGRMHQIRATLYSLGFPVVGDKLYGIDDRLFLKIRSGSLTEPDRLRLRLPRQALHAAQLRFRHPDDGRKITVAAPYPEDFFPYRKSTA